MADEITTRITEIVAQNTGPVRYIIIRPGDRDITEIVGDNGVGKSTVLSLIDKAVHTSLAGEMPITKGEKEGSVAVKAEVQIGGKTLELDVVRKWTLREKDGVWVCKSKVLVSPAKIGDFSTPAAILEAFFGKERVISTDKGFTRLSNEDQIRALTAAVSVEVDEGELEDIVTSAGVENFIITGSTTFEKIKSARESVEEHRKTIGRDVKSLKSVIASLPATKVEAVDIGKLQEEEKQVEAHNAARKKLTDDLERYKDAQQQLLQQYRELEQQIKEMMQKAQELDNRIVAAGAAIVEQQKKVDAPDTEKLRPLEEIKADIASAAEKSVLASKFQERLESEKTLKEREEQYALCSETLASLKTYQAMKVDVSRLGVDGLELIDDDTTGQHGVYVGGVPVAQLGATDSAILDVRVAIALNPKIKLLRVDEWNTYDKKRQERIHQIAKEHDMDIIVARVGAPGEKVGIEITDDGYTTDHYEEAKAK